MPNRRPDPISHDWVIVNPERARRPHNRGDAVARPESHAAADTAPC